jgi:hypothetical protein
MMEGGDSAEQTVEHPQCGGQPLFLDRPRHHAIAKAAAATVTMLKAAVCCQSIALLTYACCAASQLRASWKGKLLGAALFLLDSERKSGAM